MTTWYGARRGGRISPWSSPCTMMIAPMKRVDRPHDVVQQCCSCVVAVEVLDVERLGEVLAEVVRGAGLERRLSPIIASIV